MSPRSALLCAALALAIAGSQAQTAPTAVPSMAAIEKEVQSYMQTLLASAGPAGAGPVKAQLSSLNTAFRAQYHGWEAQAEQALAQYESQYCKPAKFTPSKKSPAKFVGHGFEIKFSTGDCFFNETAYFVDHVKELNCTEPSIAYTKAPANFTSKFHAAPKFTTKECKVTKSFGEDSVKVLYVFDGAKPMDMDALTKKITAEVKNMLAAMAPGAGTAGTGFQAASSTLMGSMATAFPGWAGASAAP